MTNAEIRKALAEADVKVYELAAECGINDITMCRWLRVEMTDQKKKAVLEAVERAAQRKKAGEPLRKQPRIIA